MFFSKTKPNCKFGDLATGYSEIDKHLPLRKGDLVTVQSMTNHGKTTFMLQLAYQFLSVEENLGMDPMCLFVTYESGSEEVKERLLEIVGFKTGENDQEGKVDEKIGYLTRLLRDGRIRLVEKIELEELEGLVEKIDEECPGRTKILFLDHFQIIKNRIESTTRERNMCMAIKLRNLAQKKISSFLLLPRSTKKGRLGEGDNYTPPQQLY